MPTRTRPERASLLARRAIETHGRTYAQEAGITLADTPSPLYRLLVLCVLLANRMPTASAVGAAVAVSRAGIRTPGAMTATTWQQRGDLLAAAGYRRFAGRAATVLGDGAQLVVERWGGDLRRLHAEAPGEPDDLRSSLELVPGIGRLGSAIFCREVQGVWPDVAPFADERVLVGARALGLPASPEALRSVAGGDLVSLVAACVRASFLTAPVAPSGPDAG